MSPGNYALDANTVDFRANVQLNRGHSTLKSDHCDRMVGCQSAIYYKSYSSGNIVVSLG